MAVIPPFKMQRAVKVRMTSIAAKKSAGLDRVRELLRNLPPEVGAKLDQSELKTGVVIADKKNPPDKGLIQSPGDGIYCWNGSNAMTEPVIVEKIVGFASG